MKNIFLRLFAVMLTMFVFSCSEHDDIPVFQESLLHFDKEKQTAIYDGDLNSGVNEVSYFVTNKVSSTHSVELVFDPAKSSAVLGTDFTIINNLDELTSGEAGGKFVIDVKPAAAIAKKNAVFTLKSNSLGSTFYRNEILVEFVASCSSDLGGTYQYSTTTMFTPEGGGISVPGPVTGTVNFTPTAVNGEYSVSDASFGGYAAMGYGGVASNVKLKDACNKLSFVGKNQYGDDHFISNVVVSGNQLTFKWSTSYGEYGTTTLTKTGGNWPPLN